MLFLFFFCIHCIYTVYAVYIQYIYSVHISDDETDNAWKVYGNCIYTVYERGYSKYLELWVSFT